MTMLIGQTPSKAAGAPAAVSDAASAPGEIIKDGTQASFMADVIEASRSVPVLVDFWAPWCGPCKQLTPALEKVTRAADGRIRLVKIDVDKNRALIAQLAQLGLPMQSVPTVAAFWQGQIADLFQGALSETEIKRFVETLLKAAGGALPSADLLAEARAAMEAGNPDLAAQLFEALVSGDPEGGDGWGGLIRAVLAAGHEDEAKALLAQVPAKLATHAEVAGARAALQLATEGRKAAAGLAALQARLAADPADHAARFDLATAYNAMGQRAEAADALLEIMRQDRTWRDDGARLQLLRLFEAWGLEDPASLAARRRLSALLFR